MADPIQGDLEIQTDPGAQTRILLDPDGAQIIAGGNGDTGDVVLKDGEGNEIIRIGRIQEFLTVGGKGGGIGGTIGIVSADYHGIRIRTPEGENLVQIGLQPRFAVLSDTPDDIGIVFGGAGFSARMKIVDKNERTRLLLGQDSQGRDGRFQILGPTGQKLLDFDPTTAALYVGGTGNEGDIIVRDEGNRQRIKLDGGEGDITVDDVSGNRLLHFDTNFAALWVGGTGNEGDVIVRNENNTETIKLDGGQCTVSVRNSGGTETVRLDGNAGDIVLSGADCAEEFDVAEDVDRGTVLVIDDDERLRSSNSPYDRRVAGVVSGAGDYQPGIVLGRRTTSERRPAVALAGRVHCRVDATEEPIGVGDLLVSSDTPGHAMRASDPTRWPGAVLGKALRGMSEGRGMIPILVTLQ